MRNKSVWERACGLTRTVVEGVDFDDDAQRDRGVGAARRARRGIGAVGAVVVRRVTTSVTVVGGGGRWISARRKCSSRRTRRGFGVATHGVTVAAVPWARHGAGHTRDFDDLAAWLAVRTSKSAVMELLRVAWRTVGSIVTRVNADIDATVDRLDGLRRIGIDEISYKRGHRYLIVVVDHDTRPARVGRTGPQRHRPERVLRRARPRTRRAAHPRFGRYGRLDRPRRRAPGPERGAQRRSVPCRRVGDRRARYRTSPRLEPSQRPSLRPSVSPAKDARPATRNTSPNRVTRCGRTPVISPAVNVTSSTGSPRPTRGCGARTSSKKDCVTCSRSKAKKANTRSTDGRAGRADRGSPRSCNSNAGSPRTAKRSTSRSTPASPKDSSNPRTPRSDSSPASRSGSTDTNHSSRSRCSPSDHTHPASPAATDPRKQQESGITADLAWSWTRLPASGRSRARLAEGFGWLLARECFARSEHA